jgi:hypothetical protein
MEISLRDLLTVLHGMGFVALFMLAFSGAVWELHRVWSASHHDIPEPKGRMILRVYLVGMVTLAWLAVLSGAYIIYPWYRAVPPAGLVDLAAFPRSLLLSSPHTSGWHNLGMEWKEQVAWCAPIAMTMVAYVYWKYGRDMNKHSVMRATVLGFTAAAFIATGVAGVFGVFLEKVAPVHGGEPIQLMHGE